MAASIILPSICSHQVALPANNYTGMHLLKLMRGAPAGGDAFHHLSVKADRSIVSLEFTNSLTPQGEDITAVISL